MNTFVGANPIAHNCSQRDRWTQKPPDDMKISSKASRLRSTKRCHSASAAFSFEAFTKKTPNQWSTSRTCSIFGPTMQLRIEGSLLPRLSTHRRACVRSNQGTSARRRPGPGPDVRQSHTSYPRHNQSSGFTSTSSCS